MMCTGEAGRVFEESRRRVVIVGADGRTRWNQVFDHNPILSRSLGPEFKALVNGPNARPYIASKTSTKWTWKPYRPIRGVVYLMGLERAEAERFAGRVIIEPNVKRNGHTNKAWPWARWQAVVDAFPPNTFVQCLPPVPTKRLERVELAPTRDFRTACAVMEISDGFVGAEGGLHHAAAAFDKPAVVLWSEFIAPEFTGYDDQRNIRHAGEACGSRLPCATCAASMDAISVEEVVANLKEWVL